MKIDANLLSHCRNLAFTIAPELRRRPLYLVDLSLFDGLPGINRGRCLAWAHSGHPVDYSFRERIGAAWRGPGPIVAFDGDAIAAELSCPDYFRDGVLNTLLHELAHLLPPPEKYPTKDYADKFDVPAMREWQDAKRMQWDTVPAPESGSADDWHGPEFVRVAVHLLARAQLIGWQIPAFSLFGGSLWHAPQPPHWLLLLLREVVEMRHRPFSEIVSTPPPEAFSELWESCLSFRLQRETKCKEIVQ